MVNSYMNYQRIYDQLVQLSQSKNRKKLKKDHLDYIYYEWHHIIPESFFILRKRKGNKGWLEGNPNSVPMLKIICPRCNKEGGISQMKRYHLDNCKFIFMLEKI
jgi:5-methylcytosine-specific restriction endonuclease McrA